MSKQDESPLTFPTAFPIKVMGYATAQFENEVMRIMHEHVPDLKDEAVRKRDSSNKKYLAITVTINAQSRQQLDTIYQALTDSEHVLMAL